MVHRRIQARGFLGAAIVGALVVSALVVVPGVAASAASPPPLRHLASGPLPAVTPIPAHAGSHGYPYDAVPTKSSFPGAPTINLAHFGYVEREFTMSGTHEHLPAERVLGLERQCWNVSVAQTQRALHDAPAGALPHEPGQVQRDRGGGVAQRHHRRRPGPGVVGDLPRGPRPRGTPMSACRRRPAAWSRTRPGIPQRYGSLGDSSDGQSYDIFTPGGAGGSGGRREPARWPEAGHGHRRGRLAVGVPGGHLRTTRSSRSATRSMASLRSAAGCSRRRSAAAWSRPRRSRRSSAPTARRRSSRSRPRETSRYLDSRSPGSPTTPTCAPGNWPGRRTSTCTRGSMRQAPFCGRIRS